MSYPVGKYPIKKVVTKGNLRETGFIHRNSDLTIKINGETEVVYNGSEDKEININTDDTSYDKDWTDLQLASAYMNLEGSNITNPNIMQYRCKSGIVEVSGSAMKKTGGFPNSNYFATICTLPENYRPNKLIEIPFTLWSHWSHDHSEIQLGGMCNGRVQTNGNITFNYRKYFEYSDPEQMLINAVSVYFTFVRT